MEKSLLAMLGSCPAPKRSHSGLGVRCLIDELEGRQGRAVVWLTVCTESRGMEVGQFSKGKMAVLGR